MGGAGYIGSQTLLGKGDAVQRRCGNLQVDIFKARQLLGSVPPVSVEDALVNDLCRHRRLDQGFAVITHPFAADTRL